MQILLGTLVCIAIAAFQMHLLWKRALEELEPKELERPLGWRCAVKWAKEHGYNAVDADIIKGEWHVYTAEGWVSVATVMSWPKRQPIPMFMERLSNYTVMERAE